MLLQDSVNFGDRLQASFAQVFGDIVPALLGALVILFAGYLLAKLLEKLIERFLRRIRLNRMLERGDVMHALERSGSHVNPTRVLANLVFCRPGATVVELFNRSYVNGCFWQVAALGNLDYRPVVRSSPEPLAETLRRNRDDIAADVPQVLRALA